LAVVADCLRHIGGSGSWEGRMGGRSAEHHQARWALIAAATALAGVIVVM